MATLFYTILLSLILCCLCHVKLHYPPPRSDQYAARSNGPCGGDTWEDGVNNGRITEWRAGETVTILVDELIHHTEQPYRIALSESNVDEGFSDCILINHVPQHTRNGPHLMQIELTLPDFECRNCTLQLINFQTGGFS